MDRKIERQKERAAKESAPRAATPAEQATLDAIKVILCICHHGCCLDCAGPHSMLSCASLVYRYHCCHAVRVPGADMVVEQNPELG